MYPLLAWGLHYLPFFIMGRYSCFQNSLILVSYTSITIFPLYTLPSWSKGLSSTISHVISIKRQSGQSSQSHTSQSQEPSSISVTSHSAWKATHLNGNISTGCQHGVLQTKTPTYNPSPNITTTTNHPKRSLEVGARKVFYSLCLYFGNKICLYVPLLFVVSFPICCVWLLHVCEHFSHLEQGII